MTPNRRQILGGLGASLLAQPTKAGAASTLLVTHASALRHDPGPGHPDRPARLAAVLERLENLPGLTRAEAPPAPRAALLRVHEPAYLARLEAAAPRREGLARLSPDMVMNADTLEAAQRAAGGAVFAVEAVMEGAAKNALVAMRPPGHHATAGAAQGFCFFNNAAVAARHALGKGAERVAIVDFDVHHGNGLQEIFWAEKNVLYCSTHQMPLYPGTGAASERGEFDTIVNAPLTKGDGGAAFRAALGSRILPRVDAFAPDLLILCAGFDAHLHDPLGGLRLMEEDFREATLRLMEIAARRCNGRIVSLLEGGYRPEDLASSAAAHAGALMGA